MSTVSGRSSITCSGAETYRAYYANDQLEEQTEYLDGEKHGRSVHYYPDGILMDERHYHRGSPNGLRRFYDENGSPNFELEYNFRGELVRETNYFPGYDELRHEILYTPETGIEKDFAYRLSGRLARMTTRREWNTLSDKYYDVSGKLIHSLAYYGDGKETVLLDSLKR